MCARLKGCKSRQIWTCLLIRSLVWDFQYSEVRSCWLKGALLTRWRREMATRFNHTLAYKCLHYHILLTIFGQKLFFQRCGFLLFVVTWYLWWQNCIWSFWQSFLLQFSVFNMRRTRPSKSLRAWDVSSTFQRLTCRLSLPLQMLATIVVLRSGKLLGIISFPDLDLSIPGKVRQTVTRQ